MIFYEDLYLSDSIYGKELKILKKIEKGSFLVNAYFVCLASNQVDLFDIISARELAQKGYPKSNISVVAICESWDEAVSYISDVVTEAFTHMEQIDLKQIYSGRWEDSLDFS